MMILEVLIAVSEESLLLAESRIAGCISCTDRANRRFDAVIHDIIRADGEVHYVLPEPALCPMCQGLIFESTLIQMRESAKELQFGIPD